MAVQNNKDTHLSRAEVKQIVREATQLTMQETFLLLGVDITNPEELRAWRMDHEYMHQQRKATDDAKRMMKVTLWKVVPAAILGFLAWAGIVFMSGLREFLIEFLSGAG
jgi:hypothetical protein